MKFPFDLPAEKEFDVVGFGTNAVDHLIRVPEYPAFNSKIELTGYLRSAGGEVATTLVGLQRLGRKTAYAGRFGGDDAGCFGLESVENEGVDIGHTGVIPDAATQIAFIVIDEKTGERTIIWHRDASLAYAEQEVPIEAAIRGRILHMTPHDTAACIRMAAAAREQGTLVSLDCDNVFDRLYELLPLIDILIVSAGFPRLYLGVNDIKSGLGEIRSRTGCPIVGATLGDAGSIMLCGDSVIETPAFPVPGGCVDTTGAGDAFRAGFLFGVLSGSTVEDASIMANAVAALKCRGDGARATLPTFTELNSLIKKA